MCWVFFGNVVKHNMHLVPRLPMQKASVGTIVPLTKGSLYIYITIYIYIYIAELFTLPFVYTSNITFIGYSTRTYVVVQWFRKYI